ncbi:hypothetical protein UT300018_09170 [Clostridium faecium]
MSQCIKAGGIPTDNTWFKDSNAWIRVIELRSWLLNKGYVSEYDWQSNSKVGDIVQLYNAALGSWTHSMIINYKDPWGSYIYLLMMLTTIIMHFLIIIRLLHGQTLDF